MKLQTLKLLTFSKEHNDLNKNDLYQRVVYSYLCQLSRRNEGASARTISEDTGIHMATIKRALTGLAHLVSHDGKQWVANKPDGEFSTTKITGKHWSESLAYVLCFVPSYSEIEYTETKAKFGWPHAVVYSFISRSAKNGIVGHFTMAFTSTVLGLSIPTVRGIVNDLIYIGWIKRTDFGSHSVIAVIDGVNHEQFLVKKPEPVGVEVEAHERTVKPKPAKESIGTQILKTAAEMGLNRDQTMLECGRIQEYYRQNAEKMKVGELQYILAAFKKQLKEHKLAKIITDNYEVAQRNAERVRKQKEHDEWLKEIENAPTLENNQKAYERAQGILNRSLS